jgi:exodeoxyribonuclease V alpha subunit
LVSFRQSYHFREERSAGGEGSPEAAPYRKLETSMSLPFQSRLAPDPAATVTGVLERVVFANEENAWSVVRLTVPGEREPVTAVGNLLGVQPGENLRLEGQWVNDPKFGRQFKVASYATVAPSTREGIERYLGSGMVPGVGKEMAKRLVAAFGLATLDVIEREPERLKEVPGIGPKRRAEIERAFAEQREAREVMVFLQSHGVATGHAIKICKRYGQDALRQVREDPYRLAIDIHGIGFLSADRIAAALGFSKTAPQRVEAGVLHLLAEAADRGHLFLPAARLTDEAARLLAIPAAPVEAAVATLAAAEQVVVEPLRQEPATEPPAAPAGDAVYLKPLHAAEAGLAARLRALLAQPALPLQIDAERAVAWFERKEGVTLAPAQREAVRRGLASKVLVVTGGPGTGKTTLVRGIVRILEKKERTVALAAPTGRAAKRLAEATGSPAATIHRLLEFDPRSRRFLRDRERPLACDLLIVDEASMLDTVLAYHLLKAIPNGGRLILVGDVDQLPSVGPGRVLGDLIRSRAVDVVELDHIFRQGERSQIVANAHRIQRGELPVASRDEGGDFFLAERGRPEEVLETLVELVTRRIPARFGLDPFDEIQVLSPMNRGLLGTDNLNQVLREVLNPRGAALAHGAHSLRVGDKVMQVRNDYELEVWNGDLGRVTGIDAEGEQLAVEIDGRKVLYDFPQLDELTLAYACTIHKSQGSEYPCVVIPLHTQHHVMLQRNLLYTAVTRARRLAVVVGERRAIAVAVGNGRTGARFTMLAERLAGG